VSGCLTKLQSQRPFHVKTPVPTILSTEIKQHQDSQYLDGFVFIQSQVKKVMARQAGVVSHSEAMIQVQDSALGRRAKIPTGPG
jgi:hypothetical protein